MIDILQAFQARTYRVADQHALRQVIDRVCAYAPWMRTRCFEPTPVWLHALDQPACLCHLLLLATVSDRVVGWCRAFPSEETASASDVTLGIGLLEMYCNRGIGKAMIGRTLNWASRVGYTTASLTVHPANRRAQHVFTTCGFRSAGRSASGVLAMTRVLEPQHRGATRKIL